MTINALRLQNFMGFQDTGWIELAPISLLFGRNSSGKSAIIRALCLLKQSYHYGRRDAPLVFRVEGELDLGDYLTVVHRTVPVSTYLNEESAMDIPVLSFHFRAALPNVIDTIRERINKGRTTPITVEDTYLGVDLSISFRWERTRKEVELLDFKVSCPWPALVTQEALMFFAAEWIGGAQHADGEGHDQAVNNEITIEGWHFSSDLFPVYASRTESELWQQAVVNLTSGFLPRVDPASEVDTESIDDFGLVLRVLNEYEATIKRFLDSIVHIGPLRPFPQRWYVLNENEQALWRRQGWSAYLRFLSNDINQSDLDAISEWMKNLQLGSKILPKWQYAAPWGVVAQINVKELPESTAVFPDVEHNLVDMGFGIGQVLPVIVQCLLASPGSLVIIEQPELHLHPAAQAELGDLFLQAAAQNKIRLVIETHSEHLLLRLRRRIAESTVDWITHENLLYTTQQTIGVNYIMRVDGKSELVYVEINRLGEIVSPRSFKGFFSDDLKEIEKLAEASLEIATER